VKTLYGIHDENESVDLYMVFLAGYKFSGVFLIIVKLFLADILYVSFIHPLSITTRVATAITTNVVTDVYPSKK
jgi:hypothetical protein